MRLRLGSLSLLVLCVATTFVLADGNDKVQAQLLADVASIAPGKAFWLGVHYTIQPGFHIYWKNAGDSGLPTDVKLNLPEGFKADALQFPVPTRIQLPGDIINYVYENEVMLLVRITPPPNLPPEKPITITVDTTWLVCKEDCEPGRASLSIDLPASDSPAPVNAGLFKTWGGRLPLSQDSADVADVDTSRQRDHVQLTVHWTTTPSNVQYFPGPLTTGEIDNMKLDTSGKTTTISFDVKERKDNEPVPGLVAFTRSTGIRTALQTSVR